MRHGVREIPALLATPIGRFVLFNQLRLLAWPLYAGIAGLHRRTVARHTRLVTVVGSYGKSTAARATAAALGTVTPSGTNAGAALAKNLLGVRASDVCRVLEVGIGRPGQMRRYARMVRPDVTIVTSIGSEHRRSLGTIENTRHEKADMVRALPGDGLAVLNGDDPNVAWMRGQTGARVITYGLGDHNDLVASDVRSDWPRGTRFRVDGIGAGGELHVKLLGWPMVYAATAAAATALAEGVPFDEVAKRLAGLEPTPGRLEVVELPNGAVLLRDDFKSGLETIDAALDVLESIPVKRKLAVLGDVNEPPGRQGEIYRRLGARLARITSKVVLVGDHPRSYATGARRAGMSTEAIVDAGHSVHAATEAIRTELRAGDVVLVKGRSSQGIARISLGLMGRHVGCAIESCSAGMPCEHCPMLEGGWGARRVVT